MRFAELEHVERADQVVFDQLAAARATVHSGQHAWVGGGVHDPVHGTETLEVGRESQITVTHANPKRRQGAAIHLAAGSREVVDADDLNVGGRGMMAKCSGDRASY